MPANDTTVQPAANDNASPWLTYEQACEYLHVAKSTLFALVHDRKIPVYGSPRMRRFRRDMLDLWLVNRDLALRRWAEERKRTW